jgi:hypothetical protein
MKVKAVDLYLLVYASHCISFSSDTAVLSAREVFGVDCGEASMMRLSSLEIVPIDMGIY